MLLQIRDFIQREKQASIEQLARAFHIDEQALQPMLNFWLQRKVITVNQGASNCRSTCGRCNIKIPMIYQSCCS
jgi:hypothetical protein